MPFPDNPVHPANPVKIFRTSSTLRPPQSTIPATSVPAALPLSAFHFPPSAFSSALRHPQRASALVISLLIVVILTIIVVAFMQSMAVERMTSRSYANKLKSQLMVEAGISDAASRIWEVTETGPYATAFSEDEETAAPYLYFAKRELNENQGVTRRTPLFSTNFSGSDHFDATNPAFVDPEVFSLNDLDVAGNAVQRTVQDQRDIFCDINENWGLYPNGLVGLQRNGQQMNIPVNWIYVHNTEGQVVGRYAFWVDDECSKIDLRFAGNTEGPDDSHLRRHGETLDDISLHVFEQLGLSREQVANLVGFKDSNLPVSMHSFARYPQNGGEGLEDDALWHNIRPYVTIHSLHDDRAPDGMRRMNLNEVVTTTNNPGRILQEVDAIVEIIRENLPDFALRYHDGTVSAADQEIYLRKIAANIRDMIDSDNTATVLVQNEDGDYVAVTSAEGDFVPYLQEIVNDELPIVGKEQGPFLSEYLRVARVLTPPFVSPVTPEPLIFRLAHYIELHNPSNRTITYTDLGSNPHLLLSNRLRWFQIAAGEPETVRPADLRINLPEDFTIPPGGFAVITTDGAPFDHSQQSGILSPPGVTFAVRKGTGPGTWQLVNTPGTTPPMDNSDFEDYEITTITTGNNLYGLRLATENSTYANNQERLLFGNDGGIIDVTLGIFTATPWNTGAFLARNERNPLYASTFIADSNTTSNNTLNGGTTEPRFTRGDVRSNAETTRIGSNTGSVWKAGNTPQYGNNFNLLQASLGEQNFRFADKPGLSGVALWRRGWREFTPDPAGNHFVVGRPLRSIGELGFIYDPARFIINSHRSYGSTLRMGQSDDGTANRANSNAVNFVNWLGGLGADDPSNPRYFRNAFLLADLFRVDDVTEGRINPSSVARDGNGFVLSALMDGFNFYSDMEDIPSAAIGGNEINSTNVAESILEVISGGDTLVSLGDISRAPIFRTGVNLSPGATATNVSSAGKEEFFRRSANLLTTQSLAFTVFVVGQAGTFFGDSFRPSATSLREATFQVLPSYPDPENEFDRVEPESWNLSTVRSIQL